MRECRRLRLFCLIQIHDGITFVAGDIEFAWRTLYVLELAKQKSDVNHKFKFMLIRLYCDFGIFMPCASIYDSLDIKHVQQDTLGWVRNWVPLRYIKALRASKWENVVCRLIVVDWFCKEGSLHGCSRQNVQQNSNTIGHWVVHTSEKITK